MVARRKERFMGCHLQCQARLGTPWGLSILGTVVGGVGVSIGFCVGIMAQAGQGQGLSLSSDDLKALLCLLPSLCLQPGNTQGLLLRGSEVKSWSFVMDITWLIPLETVST